MKITDLRACQPRCDSPSDWRTSMGQILVAVDTDAGLTGYGVGGGGMASIHVVRTVLRDLLLGRSPEPIAHLWQAMYDATLPFGRKGLAIMALSGVDLALWDLKGRAEKKSVTGLLGGAKHSRLPVYVTVWGDVDPALIPQYRGFKLHVDDSAASRERKRPESAADNTPVAHAPGSPEILELVARTRNLLGPDPALMLDAWMKWDVPTTLAVAEQIAPYNVAWIEEPLPADDFAGYYELSQRCQVPIAGGEHEFTAAGFKVLIDQRLHQVLQPDVCWCGGLTELVKIYDLAHKAGLRVCPHRGGELWTLPALAALDPNPLAESGRPWMTWVGGQPPIVDGCITPSDAPGFGVNIDESTLHI